MIPARLKAFLVLLEFPITLNGATGPSTIKFEEIPPANGNSRFLSNEYAALGIQFIATDDGSIWAGSLKATPAVGISKAPTARHSWGFNGASYSLAAKFTSSITDFSLAVSRSAGSSAGNTFTLQGYLAGGLIDSQTITLGPINSWSTITLTHDNLDEVRWFGSGSGYHPYGVDNVTWVSAVPEPSMLVLLGIGAVGLLAFLCLTAQAGRKDATAPRVSPARRTASRAAGRRIGEANRCRGGRPGLALLRTDAGQCGSDSVRIAAAFDAAFPGVLLEDFEAARIADGHTGVMPNSLDSSTHNAIFSTGDIIDGLRITAGTSTSGPDVVFVSLRGFATYVSHAISFRYANCTAPQMTAGPRPRETPAPSLSISRTIRDGNAVTVAEFSGPKNLGQFFVPNEQVQERSLESPATWTASRV